MPTAAEIVENTRFWDRVYAPGGTTCLLWGAARSKGYGRLTYRQVGYAAHRVAYEWGHGRLIPEGLTIDHLCGEPSCVYPGHLEAVTRGENTRRGVLAAAARRTSCRAGHPFSDANTYVKPDGKRQCRVCRRKSDARRRPR